MKKRKEGDEIQDLKHTRVLGRTRATHSNKNQVKRQRNQGVALIWVNLMSTQRSKKQKQKVKRLSLHVKKGRIFIG